MKSILILFLSLSFLRGSAQQKQFSVDENGRYIYYEVVDSIVTSKDSLMRRARFVAAKQKINFSKTTYTDSSMLASGKLILDKTMLVLGHPSGEVTYNFVSEFKNGKYRFWLTNLKYIPYQRDRYGNYVASTKIGTPLENSPDRLTAGSWKDVVESAYLKAAAFSTEFKKTLATPVALKSNPKKPVQISTKKW